MDLTELFQETFSEIEQFPADADSRKIEATAQRLASQNYSPTLLNTIENFTRLTKATLHDEIEKLQSAPARSLSGEIISGPELFKLRLDQINLILSQYQLLIRLRQDEPEAWDVINELMDDD